MPLTDNLPDTYPHRLMSPVLSYYLALDVALDVSVDSILEAHNLQHHEFEAVKRSAIFKKQLQQVTEQLEKDGGAFRIKAKVQAEALLKESYLLAMDDDVDAKVRARMIEKNVEWAGYAAPQQQGAGSGGGFQININLGEGAQATATIDQDGNEV